MRILIDGRVLDRAITGTGRYLLNILDELPNLDNSNEYFLLTNNKVVVENKFFRIVNIGSSFMPMKVSSQIWLNYVLPRAVDRYNIDLLFEPNILIPIVNLKSKSVSVVHDVIPKIYKEYYPYFYKKYLSIFLPISLRKSDKVITVSMQSKKDIIKYYNVSPDKIDVTYNTASKLFKPRTIKVERKNEFIKQLSLPQKFLLHVGVLEKRKNIEGIISILDMIREKGSKLELIFVGKTGHDFDDISPLIEKRKNYIKRIEYLDDKSLAFLYNCAFAFIFPSFYEGFGIPPLEAMQSGIPVLSSNTSALKEVVGEGGIMHNPDDYRSFADDILKLEKNNEYYLQMKTKGLEQARKFNIKEVTQKIVTVFNKLEMK